MSTGASMHTGGNIHKSRSNENLYRCYTSEIDPSMDCDCHNLYEKTPAYCSQQSSESKCVSNSFCSWTEQKCVLKDTGTTDLV